MLQENKKRVERSKCCDRTTFKNGDQHKDFFFFFKAVIFPVLQNELCPGTAVMQQEPNSFLEF